MVAAPDPSPPAPGFHLRAATRDDAESVARVINAAFVAERMAFDGDRIDPEGARRLMNTGRFLLAEGAALVGCVYIEKRGDRSYLGLLSVVPALQGTGLGRQLVSAAEEHARAAGCCAMDLRIISPRAEALLPFYRRLGYSETGTAPFASDVLPKIPSHYVLMSKPLV